MTYKLIVFDFDGTLADSFPFFLEVFGTLADAHGFKRINNDELTHIRGMHARQVMQHVGLPLWKMPAVAQHFKMLMTHHIDRIALFDGIKQMLERLAEANGELAVMTSNTEQNVRAVLGSEHARFISHYACGVSLFGKQHKLRKLLARSSANRNEVLCIGDEIRDIEAAHREELAFGAVTWGYTDIEKLREFEPDYVFYHADEIADLVLAGRN
jgi:phosphoglycolate phosphatase